MKKTHLLVLFLIVLGAFSHCKKDSEDEMTRLLTGTVWLADSLLANGVDASGPGMALEKFKGEAHFREDHTGTFGEYSGTWRFQNSQKELVITTDANPIPIIANIEELTASSLKITTNFPVVGTDEYLAIRMTFKPK